MHVAVPSVFVTDMAETRQSGRFNAVIAGAQQLDDGTAPDGFDLLFFKEQVTPGAVFDVKAAAGDGDVDMRMLIELPAVGMECAEDPRFDTLLACPTEHGAGGAAKQLIEQWPVIVEKWPQQMRHGKRDVLPVAVGQDVLLLSDPLLGGLEATAAAGLGLAALAEEAGMGAIR